MEAVPDVTVPDDIARDASALAARIARSGEDDELLDWITTLQRSVETDDVEPYEP